MKQLKIIAAISAVLCSMITVAASAECDATQQINVESGKKSIANWSGLSSQIRTIQLANNFKLGLKVEPPSREYYEALLKRLNRSSFAEMVKISVYDMTTETPRLITHTYGGANSSQGYSPRGGADRVLEVGDAGITLQLSRTNCLSAETIAALPTQVELKQVEEKAQPSQHQLRGQVAAKADIAKGIYLLAYPKREMSDAQIEIIKSEVEKAGLTFRLLDETTPPADDAARHFQRGYDRAMMEAVDVKLGNAKGFEMERNIKARMAEIKPK